MDGEEKWGEGGEVNDRRLLFSDLMARAERKKGAGGPGVRCRMEGKMGKREGGPGAARDSLAAGISPRSAVMGGMARPCRAAGRTGEREGG
jgi:hypothetical protein